MPENKIKQEIEELKNQMDEIQAILAKQKSINSLTTKKEFIFKDIPYDPQRKIDNLWLGEITGISKVRAYRATSNQVISSSAATKVQLNAEDFDVRGELDSTTNYRFTAIKPGYYDIKGAVAYAATTANKLYIAYFYKNGAVATESDWYAGGTDGGGPMVSDIIYLASNDYIELWTYHNAGVDQNVLLGSTHTFMAIQQIS